MSGVIAVVDLETTGLFPFRNDRIVEVAAVLIDPAGRVHREFSSLVNPRRDIGRSDIHGLTSEDVLSAPEFAGIAPAFIEALRGSSAIAGHNVRFDQLFLKCEFDRIGVPFPGCPSFCTMQLGWGGSLEECSADCGIPFEGESHQALVDARATARLLVYLLRDSPQELDRLLRLPPIRWPAIAWSGEHPVTRDEARQARRRPPVYIQRILQRIREQPVAPDGNDGGPMAYEALLDRVLEDRLVDQTEADALLEMASIWGLGVQQVETAHLEYLRRLAVAALADAVITPSERQDLLRVAYLLGLDQSALDSFLADAAKKLVKAGRGHPALAPAVPSNLAGRCVCFTGEMCCQYHGTRITRGMAEELAKSAGLSVVGTVTKRLDLLVVADPMSQSGKAEKARKYGIRVMHEPVFWKAVGISVE